MSISLVVHPLVVHPYGTSRSFCVWRPRSRSAMRSTETASRGRQSAMMPLPCCPGRRTCWLQPTLRWLCIVPPDSTDWPTGSRSCGISSASIGRASTRSAVRARDGRHCSGCPNASSKAFLRLAGRKRTSDAVLPSTSSGRCARSASAATIAVWAHCVERSTRLFLRPPIQLMESRPCPIDRSHRP